MNNNTSSAYSPFFLVAFLLAGVLQTQVGNTDATQGLVVFIIATFTLIALSLASAPSRIITISICIFLIISLQTFYLQATNLGIPKFFWTGSARITFYLIFVSGCMIVFSYQQIEKYLVAISIGFAIFSIFTIANQGSALLLFSGRLELTEGIGPNVYGGISAINVITLISQNTVKRKWLLTPFLLINLITLSLCFSRGAILGVICAALIGKNPLRRLFIGIVIIITALAIASMTFDLSAFVEKANVVAKIQNLSNPSEGSSGRLDVWAKYLNDMTESPISVIFGFGAGSTFYPWVRAYPFSWSILASPHSSYMASLYYYGAFGVISYLGLIYRGFLNAFSEDSFILQKRAWIFYVVTGFVDNYWLSSAAITFHALGFAAIFSNPSLRSTNLSGNHL